LAAKAVCPGMASPRAPAPRAAPGCGSTRTAPVGGRGAHCMQDNATASP
jgi:hypothetical protein